MPAPPAVDPPAESRSMASRITPFRSPDVPALPSEDDLRTELALDVLFGERLQHVVGHAEARPGVQPSLTIPRAYLDASIDIMLDVLRNAQ